ncbi:serine threonine-protein kinase [Musa troglodytarum]|uniref:Serine threonine-protein kinase n=1 Tax=Musa troglodytarum TaxID=320322 RepID=A0A9E7HVT5_9LILI|nr:serine threonine-protein kinase [Musa troglodytarum]
MGCFPCFGSASQREEEEEKVKKRNEGKGGGGCKGASLSHHGGSDKLRSRTGSDSKKEASTPKESNAGHIAAQTFTFRELAAATKNFRQDCLLGEGGFGRVYKGRLENGQARPLFKDRRKFPKMADPLLQGRYPMRGLYQALAVAAMCLQEQAAIRPFIGDVVTALSYLASQTYDPNAASVQSTRFGSSTPRSRSGSDNQQAVHSPHQNSPDLRQRDPFKVSDKGAKVGRGGSAGGSGRKWGLDDLETQESQMGSPVHVGIAEGSPKSVDPNLVREHAVAEAKLWGENWRERQQRNAPGWLGRDAGSGPRLARAHVSHEDFVLILTAREECRRRLLRSEMERDGGSSGLDLRWSYLPRDLALGIVSLLEASDVCSLGICSRLWRDICSSDSIWMALYERRWPSADRHFASPSQEFKAFYMNQHKKMASAVSAVIKYVEESTLNGSLEISFYVKALGDLRSMKLGFRDVQLFLFRREQNTVDLMEALETCQILERQVCVRWFMLRRRFYGFPMPNEHHSHIVSLGDLAMGKEDNVLDLLNHGNINERMHVQISAITEITTNNGETMMIKREDNHDG